MSTTTTTTKIINDLFDALNNFINIKQELNLTEDQENELQTKLARALRKNNPGFSGKLHEFIAADDSGLTVNKKGQGVDMFDKNKGCWESKYSKYHDEGFSHFVWKYRLRNDAESDGDYKNRILADIRKKTKEGGIIFDVGSKSEKYRAKYIIDGEFMMKYFENVLNMTETKSHNMRCNFCTKCNKYHRLEYLNHYQKVYKKNNKSLPKSTWDQLRVDRFSKCLNL